MTRLLQQGHNQKEDGQEPQAKAVGPRRLERIGDFLLVLSIAASTIAALAAAAALYFDLREMALPDGLAILTALIGLSLAAASGGAHAILLSLTAAAIAGGPLILSNLVFRQAIGSGDGLFMAAVATLLGPLFSALALLYGIGIACVIQCGYAAWLIFSGQKAFGKALKTPMPFLAGLTPGIWIAVAMKLLLVTHQSIVQSFATSSFRVLLLLCALAIAGMLLAPRLAGTSTERRHISAGQESSAEQAATETHVTQA